MGYGNYFSSSHEKVLAGLTDVGENKIYRMTRSNKAQRDRHAHQQAQKKLEEAHELLEKQGFLHSSVSLVDLSRLGLEVQLVSCTDYSGTEVFFRSFTLFYDIVSGPEEAPGRWWLSAQLPAL